MANDNKHSILNDMPHHASGGMVVPPGRTLADMPKAGPMAPPSGKPKPPNSRLTLRNLITENESKNYLITLLLEMGKKRKAGPWRDYLAFYTANLSGDVDTFGAADKKNVDKLVKDLNDEYFRQQEL